MERLELIADNFNTTIGDFFDGMSLGELEHFFKEAVSKYGKDAIVKEITLPCRCSGCDWEWWIIKP